MLVVLPAATAERAAAEVFASFPASPVRDVMGEVLREWQPRRRLDTSTMVSLVTDRGAWRWFRGARWPDHESEMASLVTAGRFRGAGLSVQVDPVLSYSSRILLSDDDAGFRLCVINGNIVMQDDSMIDRAARLTDSFYGWVRHTLAIADVHVGYFSWQRGLNLMFESQVGPRMPPTGVPVVLGYHTITYLPADVTERLGGLDLVLRAAPVERIDPVERNGRPAGAVAMLCSDPAELTDGRLREWRTFLAPVSVLPDPNVIVGRPRRLPRPFDVLAEDWPDTSHVDHTG